MKAELKNTFKALGITGVLALSMEYILLYPESITFGIIAAFAVLIPLLMFFLPVRIRSFASMNSFLLTLLFIAASLLALVFIDGALYKHLYVGFISACLFILLRKFIGMKVYEIQSMAYEQQYSFIDMILLLTSLLFYAGAFGLYLYLKAPLWLLMIGVFAANALLFFLFFYFNDLWLKKIFLYVVVLTFIMVQITWTLSYWPNGLLGRGIVLFFTYYLLSGIGKHYLKETFSFKVLREYMVVGAIVLLLVLSTTQWTY